MKVDKLVLVNWGQMAPGDYPLGQMTLLLGETGAGKSTLLDALQALMTGYHKSLAVFNPAQDEVNQGAARSKTKRTMESYIVGAEGSKFSRPAGAQGYLAAVFHPDPGEVGARPFTAVIATSARVEGVKESRQAKMESFSLYIVESGTVQFDDFMEDAGKGECVSSDAIGRRLRQRHERVVEYHDKKQDYLCALYGRFRGKNSVPKDEAMLAAKAWVQALAYKPMGSVHHLVRDEILDFDGKALEDEVSHISGVMRNVANLRKEGARLSISVELLESLSKKLTTVEDAHNERLLQALYIAKLALAHNELASQQAEALTRRLGEEIEQLNATHNSLQGEQKTTQLQLVQVSAQLSGIPAHQQKSTYENQASTAEAAIRRALAAVGEALSAGEALVGVADTSLAAEMFRGLESVEKALVDVAAARQVLNQDDLAELLAAVDAAQNQELAPAAVLDLSHRLDVTSKDVFSDLSETLIGEHGLLSAVLESSGIVNNTITAQRKELENLEQQLVQLNKGGSIYPREVEAAVIRLREEFPQAGIQVLCDLVEPRDLSWQRAIEGYMGMARYNLVVDPDWEEALTRTVKSRRWKVKVVQGDMCMKKSKGASLHPDSIVHELSTKNVIARAFLMQQFGPVLKVKSVEELRYTPRGVTKDGHGSGSFTMFACEDVNLSFGQAARAHQREQVESDMDLVTKSIETLGKQQSALAALRAPLQRVRVPELNAPTLAGDAQSLKSAREALAALDLSGLEELTQEEGRLKKRLEDIGTEIAGNRADFGSKSSERTNSSARQTSLLNARQPLLGQLEEVIARAKVLAEIDPETNYTFMATTSEKRMANGLEPLEAARGHLATLNTAPLSALSRARESVAEFNLTARTDELLQDALPSVTNADELERDFARVLELHARVRERLNLLKGTVLLTNRQELEQATTTFNEVFTTNFCAEVKSRVDDGPRTLRAMNHELQKLQFGRDKYRIDWSRWEPEFEEYRNFFEAVYLMTESMETPDLFGETSLSEANAKTRDRLVALLLDDDHDRATRELLRIADYRNYRRYDIINESEKGGMIRLSESGTASGGQNETPAYVVRAAVLSNRLKLFEKGPSLRMLGNDESFTKMDESRSRAVLRFFRDNLDLQLISAMPTMKAGPLKDEFNKEYGFTTVGGVTNGELNFVTEIDERDLKPDVMRERWAQRRAVVQAQAQELFDLNNPLEDSVDEPTSAQTQVDAPEGEPSP